MTGKNISVLVIAGDRRLRGPTIDGGGEFRLASAEGAKLGHFAGLGALLRPGALRVVVSDFLFPHDPRALVRSLGARGGGLALVQVLAREEREPDFASALRLTDCETDATLDQVVDRGAVERYRARLERLVSALDDECRRAGARFASLTAGAELDAFCRDALVPAQILVPA